MRAQKRNIVNKLMQPEKEVIFHIEWVSLPSWIADFTAIFQNFTDKITYNCISSSETLILSVNKSRKAKRSTLSQYNGYLHVILSSSDIQYIIHEMTDYYVNELPATSHFHISCQLTEQPDFAEFDLTICFDRSPSPIKLEDVAEWLKNS